MLWILKRTVLLWQCSFSTKSITYVGLQIRVCIGKLFSLFLIQNICCGCSKACLKHKDRNRHLLTSQCHSKWWKLLASKGQDMLAWSDQCRILICFCLKHPKMVSKRHSLMFFTLKRWIFWTITDVLIGQHQIEILCKITGLRSGTFLKLLLVLYHMGL